MHVGSRVSPRNSCNSCQSWLNLAVRGVAAVVLAGLALPAAAYVVVTADNRVYDVASPNNVKYAGLVHLAPSPNCPGLYCLNHFASADFI